MKQKPSNGSAAKHSVICSANINSGRVWPLAWQALGTVEGFSVQGSLGSCKQLQCPLSEYKGSQSRRGCSDTSACKKYHSWGKPSLKRWRSRKALKDEQPINRQREHVSAHRLFMCQLKVICVAFAGIRKTRIKKSQKQGKNCWDEKFFNCDFLPRLGDSLFCKSGGHYNMKVILLQLEAMGPWPVFWQPCTEGLPSQWWWALLEEKKAWCAAYCHLSVPFRPVPPLESPRMRKPEVLTLGLSLLSTWWTKWSHLSSWDPFGSSLVIIISLWNILWKNVQMTRMRAWK